MIIAMAIHDTVENNKTQYTRRCLESLWDTTNLHKNRLVLIDNNSCEATKGILKRFKKFHDIEVITLPENVGTAAAINEAWKLRQPGEHCMKIDNDVEWLTKHWLPQMEEAIQRDPTIGIVGLKRKDLIENPAHPDPYFKSELKMLPHTPGEKWIIVEEVHHVMGTVCMFNSALLDKVGYLYQPTKYGYDDVLMAKRSKVAGFKNVFLPHINIDHIDPGGGDYTAWKNREASEQQNLVVNLMRQYEEGTKSIYYNPF